MRVAAVAYVVDDYDRAIAFFTSIGFALTNDIDQGHKRWVTVRAGATELVLAQAASPDQSAVIGDQFAGRVGLFLHSEDFAADAARITGAGGVFEEAPRVEPYGTVAVWRDPWGTRWDLIQPADGT
ncbi:VOC family protein [Jannaschia pohangensis]|uniref:VOC domain-containing protein n=1 Tax=Jannaschia pohangensis TaxID=390807 RepID=A0A1I3LT15_9RHOB|nr:hypothetical protein SAMN04488095_1619 [Jannaschia pohangensis]